MTSWWNGWQGGMVLAELAGRGQAAAVIVVGLITVAVAIAQMRRRSRLE